MEPASAIAGGGGGGPMAKAAEKMPDWHAAHRTKRMTVPEVMQWAYLISRLGSLTRGRGGLTPQQRQQIRSENRGNIAAQLEEAQAALARGSATAPGVSGASGEQQVNIYGKGLGAGLQSESSLREGEMRLAERMRQDLAEQWNTMVNRREQAKQKSAEFLANRPGDEPSEGGLDLMGQLKRQKQARSVQDAADEQEKARKNAAATAGGGGAASSSTSTG